MSFFRVNRRLNFVVKRGIEELWKNSFLDNNVDMKKKVEYSRTGDAWPCVLLRKKSFEDLHKLYYICLKEKNKLLGEQYFHLQNNTKMLQHGRLKKVKLTMKRILTVLSRRAIHDQCLRAKDMLKKQEEREFYEIQKFKLNEQLLCLKHKMNILKKYNSFSLEKVSLTLSIKKIENKIQHIDIILNPLRKETMYLLVPHFKYQRKYSDLPGFISWKKQNIIALRNNMSKLYRLY
ncbi:putative mitochondrial ribosomal protein L29/L47 precursor [Plasmodium gaboni]|uniref:Large ribosomal subunit protein uL29m n=1 Tax=Plasmodium gaboni TaxID=647221 RepID=A0A151LVR5_9APIC|nr:putative mitochondrial ribosomal protein L29/L47 precursor [Plasmodium gaboni]KYO03268.1 putative mitochondrial ribosomal protein L29/L47 precursor [Plasmodium gaboni]SOV10937.1 mitochondrial ribosomal protein L29/L47 precursor, putative [Plasmodium gaboni]SOV20899.1 mitochondrial ribosomal protein L29/L47 precursor, putative [Plasmodium sp. DRC-Itaito]